MAEIKQTVFFKENALCIRVDGHTASFLSNTQIDIPNALEKRSMISQYLMDFIDGLSPKDQALVLRELESEYAKLNEKQRINTNNLEQWLRQRESELVVLEEISKLEKRSRKYKTSDPNEVWATRWIASPIAYLLPEKNREEWLGDLYEINREMLHKRYPQWMISVINIGRTAILIISALQVKLSDVISLGFKRTP